MQSDLVSRRHHTRAIYNIFINLKNRSIPLVLVIGYNTGRLDFFFFFFFYSADMAKAVCVLYLSFTLFNFTGALHGRSQVLSSSYSPRGSGDLFKRAQRPSGISSGCFNYLLSKDGCAFRNSTNKCRPKLFSGGAQLVSILN